MWLVEAVPCLILLARLTTSDHNGKTNNSDIFFFPFDFIEIINNLKTFRLIFLIHGIMQSLLIVEIKALLKLVLTT